MSSIYYLQIQELSQAEVQANLVEQLQLIIVRCMPILERTGNIL